jgi:probable HAF family extracellular repeat protein
MDRESVRKLWRDDRKQFAGRNPCELEFYAFTDTGPSKDAAPGARRPAASHRATSLGRGIPLAEIRNVSLGQVIGTTTEHDEALRAFLWQDGVITNLGTLAGDTYSDAFEIHAKGQVVGLL